ncbi:hypothetical protein V9T40_002035 [Parthenolecanium corni]|uniref:Ubiquinone biosynthesis protein n=1 Tax=Parthenolecanium corni TaxID=536013 RepID=A0AAN9TFJ6_9HEMI
MKIIRVILKHSPARATCWIHLHHNLYADSSDSSFNKNENVENLKSESVSSHHHSSVSSLSGDGEGEQRKRDSEYENDVKNKILEASLNFVAEHGWTKAAIVAGAQSVGYPGVVSEMFPLGGSNLVLYYYSVCNDHLREYLIERAEAESQDPDKQKSVKLFIYDAMETRLRMIIPYIDKWPQALATLTLSKAVPTALSNLLILVDDICYYAGDRSVDLDWYVRRIALAGIYKVTELYMLQDKSPDYEETWKFLKKQLDDAATMYSCIQQSEQASQLTKEISIATFTTARNILGLNWKR